MTGPQTKQVRISKTIIITLYFDINGGMSDDLNQTWIKVPRKKCEKVSQIRLFTIRIERPL